MRRRGYRAGNYSTPLFDPYLADVQTFKPEVLEDWEIGTKIRWRSGGMSGSGGGSPRPLHFLNTAATVRSEPMFWVFGTPTTAHRL